MIKQFVEYASNILFEEFQEGDKQITQFMESRGLQEADIDKYQLGYIRPNNPMPKFVRDNLEYYESISLVINGKLSVSGRMVVPVRNIYGAYSMIACRTLGSKVKQQKYITIKDINFNKDEIMFGYYENKDSIRSANTVILVEGQFDYISLDRSGIDNVIALSGANFTRKHLQLLNEISSDLEIVFAMDNDDAGINCVKKATIDFISEFRRFYYLEYSFSDPDECILKQGNEEFLADPLSVSKIFKGNPYEIAISLNKKLNKVENFFDYYDFKLGLFPESKQDSYLKRAIYLSLCKKLLKTFENVGKFLYIVYHHNKQSQYLIEVYYAIWFFNGFNNKYGKTTKFTDDISSKYISPTDNEFILLSEIDSYESPLYDETNEPFGYEIRKGYLNKLLAKVSSLYYIKDLHWKLTSKR